MTLLANQPTAMPKKQGRPADTYRAARRNACLRGDVPQVWGRAHYFSGHRARYDRRTILSRKPSRYHPLQAAGAYLRSIGKRWMGRRSQVA